MAALSSGRQFFVIGACALVAFSTGSAQGNPIILLLQLRAENSTIKLDLDSASWIGSIHGLAGILSIFLSMFMQWRGRKLAFILSCVILIIGWILLYTAKSLAQILISESFHGCAISALSTISHLTLSEMTSPKYRNISIQTCSIIHGFGVAIAGILARTLDWRTVSLIQSIPTLVGLLITVIWPESPSWLAYKRRFQECEKAFNTLRSTTDSSKKELEELITAQKYNFRTITNNQVQSLSNVWYELKKREFYLPLLHTFLLLFLTYGSGICVIMINNAELMHKCTNNNKAKFVGGITTNVVLFLGLCSSNVLSKYFANKTVILWSVTGAVVCMIGLFFTTLLFDKESLLSVYLIVAYVAVASPGLFAINFTVTSEIVPVKYRGIGGIVYTILNSSLFTFALKTSTYLFIYINMWGTFLLYALNTLVCGLLIWRFVPETKNRTLQQIENFYVFGDYVDTRMKCNDVEEPFVPSLVSTKC